MPQAGSRRVPRRLTGLGGIGFPSRGTATSSRGASLACWEKAARSASQRFYQQLSRPCGFHFRFHTFVHPSSRNKHDENDFRQRGLACVFMRRVRTRFSLCVLAKGNAPPIAFPVHLLAHGFYVIRPFVAASPSLSTCLPFFFHCLSGRRLAIPSAPRRPPSPVYSHPQRFHRRATRATRTY